MGFCLFNNVAIGAHWLRTRGVGRILIVDWDVHHGNGTQESFYDDPDTLYVSTHQYPFYPGTGAAREVGRGAAAGRTLNVPLPAGCGDDEYVAAFTDLIDPVARQFRPEFVLISAGFDADYRDPLAGMQATDAGFRAMTRVLMRVADAHASGRVAAILEGGYDLGRAPRRGPGGARRARRRGARRCAPDGGAACARADAGTRRSAGLLGSSRVRARARRYVGRGRVARSRRSSRRWWPHARPRSSRRCSPRRCWSDRAARASSSTVPISC